MISMMYGVAMAGNDEELEGRDHLGGQGTEAVRTTTSTWDHLLRQMAVKMERKWVKIV